MTRRDSASERQIQAASPLFSTWLSANAGSGKTKVLTDRVARLLLDGVAPLHILCLTYTKAAASEMQNRLFRRLGEWAMLDNTHLTTALRTLGLEGQITSEHLRNARRLFARAIETPGGLKIQTIHSFCASLLRRFPLEAGVSPQFSEMDERAARILRAEVVEELAEGPDGILVDNLARFYTGDNLDRLTEEIVKFREAFAGGNGQKTIWSSLDLPPDTDEQSILTQVWHMNDCALLERLVQILQDGTTNDVKAHTKLSSIDPRNVGLPDLEVLESVFLTGETATEPFSAKIGTFPTKNTRDRLGDALPSLNELMQRVEMARETRLRLQVARKTLALHEFANAFLKAYDARKQLLGRLDFDDLILRARHLLNDSRVAQWVLFKLDGGIDHLLVDEAQDTSPAQWDVIRFLAQEFTSGQGARENTPRTIFVVGDKKQSIYSFHGADPDAFDRMGQFFKSRIETIGLRFQELDLEFSFRSARPILALVDNTFKRLPDQSAGFKSLHRSFKYDMPGRVDLWPLVPTTKEKENRDWFDPVDIISENHHNVVLAKQIAGQIKDMLENASIPAETGKPGCFRMRRVRPGDFLILVQGRQDLFSQIIQACKHEELPIAGADILKIGAELAVKDLAALLCFLATPEDDLSLAAALRSPLFGWSEQDLFDLAHDRPLRMYLFEALRNRKTQFSETLAILESLRNAADFLRPYELLERILIRFGGRKNLLARLGAEAEDGIDAILSLALSYETMEIPSLTGFLLWLQAEDVTIKRKIDNASDRIRVMTVHGAKGLEAPIVILPDTLKSTPSPKNEILPDGHGNAFWKTARSARPKAIASLWQNLVDSQAQERLRLLYVAMTRAEKWLIVCGAGTMPKKGQTWYGLVTQGMQHSGAVEHAFINGNGLRLESGDWTEPASETDGAGPVCGADLPEWAEKEADIPPRPEQTLSPSDLGGAKALAGDIGNHDEEAAMRRGRLLHLLLEYLPNHPTQSWPDVARSLLSAGPDAANPKEIATLLAQAGALVKNPDLAFLFTPSALAEVPVSATLEELGNRRIHGTIDRLLINKDRVLAVDFKTNARVPERPDDVPDGLLRQLGAYGAALAQIFPDKRIDLAILWTESAELMPLSHDAVTAALRATCFP